MSVKILTEINPHADGVHCGFCSKIDISYTFRKITLYCSQFDVDLASTDDHRIYVVEYEDAIKSFGDIKRCAKCLAAQKEAERMTAMKRSDFDELIEDIKIEVFGYGGTNWIPQINKLLDRFYPMPQPEKEKGEIIWRCQCGQDIDDSLAVCPFCGRLHRIQFQEPQPQTIEQELKKYDSLERQ